VQDADWEGGLLTG
nr:immunoglobulin heavy chain junction region [Mus musculus]